MTIKELIRAHADDFNGKLAVIVSEFDEGRLTKEEMFTRIHRITEETVHHVFEMGFCVGTNVEEATDGDGDFMDDLDLNRTDEEDDEDGPF